MDLLGPSSERGLQPASPCAIARLRRNGPRRGKAGQRSRLKPALRTLDPQTTNACPILGARLKVRLR